MNAIHLPSGENRAMDSLPGKVVIRCAVPPPADDGPQIVLVAEDDVIAMDVRILHEAGLGGTRHADTGPCHQQRHQQRHQHAPNSACQARTASLRYILGLLTGSPSCCSALPQVVGEQTGQRSVYGRPTGGTTKPSRLVLRAHTAARWRKTGFTGWTGNGCNGTNISDFFVRGFGSGWRLSNGHGVGAIMQLRVQGTCRVLHWPAPRCTDLIAVCVGSHRAVADEFLQASARMPDEQSVEPNSLAFTIGHSNHSEQEFLALLRQHAIDVVADVRSQPYCGYATHFNAGHDQADAGQRRNPVRVPG